MAFLHRWIEIRASVVLVCGVAGCSGASQHPPQDGPGDGAVAPEACDAGRCLATLADGLSSPQILAVSANSVFWSSGTTVMRAPIGGGPSSVFVSGDRHPYQLGVDATYLYWSTFDNAPDGGTVGTLNRQPLAGGATSTLVSETNGILGFAVDATRAYFATSVGGVESVPLGGGSVTVLASSQETSTVAVSDTRVFWATLATPGGRILSVPLAGGTPVVLATEQDRAGPIATDGTNVYWQTDDATIARIPVAGGTLATLATEQERSLGDLPFSIAIDATSIYWTVQQDGTVKKVPIGGGTVTTLASGQANPESIVVDGRSVYWVNEGALGSPTGSVIKLTPK